MKFYLIEQATEFLDGKTTFSSSYEKADYTEFPSIIICFSPPFKGKLGKSLGLVLPDHDYGDYGFYEYKYDGDNENETIEDSFDGMTYANERDYQIQCRLFDRKNKLMQTQPDTEYDQFATVHNGRCLKITIWETLQAVKRLELRLVFNGTDKKKLVLPKQAELFIASSQSWPGLILDKWPFFQVEPIPLRLKNESFLSVNVGIKPIKLEFLSGTKDFSNCLEDALDKERVDCLPLIYRDMLDMTKRTLCQDGNEFEQSLAKMSGSDLVMNCFKPKSTYLYQSLRPSFEETSAMYEETIVEININPYSSTLEVKKEILVLDASTFIGSIGGSLGLFLGFSIFSYLSGLIDWVVTKIALIK